MAPGSKHIERTNCDHWLSQAERLVCKVTRVNVPLKNPRQTWEPLRLGVFSKWR